MKNNETIVEIIETLIPIAFQLIVIGTLAIIRFCIRAVIVAIGVFFSLIFEE